MLLSWLLLSAALQDPPAKALPAPAERDRASITAGVELLLGMQEAYTESGEDGERAEWPYEGVYRVPLQIKLEDRRQRRSVIPMGYRVGGMSIAGLALLEAPGLDEQPERLAALLRAVGFVAGAAAHPDMNPDYPGGYDVRGWGYCYGLSFLLRVKDFALLDADLSERVEQAIRAYVEGLAAIEIPLQGGWTYARTGGLTMPSPPSPFMTAPCLQALFAAAREGYAVDPELVERGLQALVRSRTESGAVAYAVTPRVGPGRDMVPGAVGRMLAVESTLLLAGRSSPDRVRGAIDAFIVHWQWLEKRRARSGTHVGPYGIAPYYFYYAHYYAAQAIEMLPDAERAEYRRRLRELVYATQAADGSWNDRVFERSANYGTAMCVLALLMPALEPPAGWPSPATESR